MKNSVDHRVVRCRQWAGRAGVACFIAAAVLAARAQAPAIITGHSTYFTGEDIMATFMNGPGNPKDWVGIYPEGQEPGQGVSTLWYYVDNTQTGAQGLREGSVTFAGGLNAAGNWLAYLLLDDGYTKLATNAFTVVDPGTTLVRTDKRAYAPGETITVTFYNGPANPKDWIGIYQEGQQPGGPDSTRWAYTDGADGTTGMTDGSVQFANGLNTPGNYVAFFLLNDSYDVLSSETFSVLEPSAGKPRLLSQRPANNASNQPPVVEFTFAITNGLSKVAANTVELKVDGLKVDHSLAQQADLVTITYTNDTLFAAGSPHQFALTFADNATPPNNFTIQGAFTVGVYLNLVLPDPLYFENFDNTPEGELPPGWTEQNFTDITNPELDLGNLDSASYATWTAVNADRFRGSFVTYSNPDNPAAWAEDYHRVLSVNPLNVVNGKVYNEPLAKGRFLFANSGYRNGRSQVMYLFTPDYDLTGKQDIYLSFHSLWEQNQDSIGAVEYSIDQGQTWLPIVYMLQGFPDSVELSDILLDAKGNVDALATFNTAYDDVARYTDPNTGEDKGGTYGTFIGAAISQDLAPFISPRVNDDPVESKRIELFRLPAADNQANVRFRFAHAGSDSWYFGIDDFGLYSISTVEPAEIAVEPADVTVTSGDAASLSVQATGTPPLLYEWFHNDQAMPEATGPSLNFASAKPADAGRYFVRVTNAARTVQSRTATLTVNPRPPAVTGAWDFDRGDLSLTAGVGELAYADGATTQSLTAFGTTDGTPAAPHINGQPAKFMRVPAFADMANGYVLTMPTAPNGGGSYVNRYTIVLDLLVPSSVGWTPLFNTSPSNGNDADFYVSDTGALGISTLGYSPADTIAPDTWYRIAFVADLGAGKVAYYVNGSLVHTRTGASLLDGQFALSSGNDAGPDVLFFNEPTGSYTHELLVNSIMFTDRRMSAEEIQALGGPSAAGIPADVTAAPLQVAASLQGATLTLSWSGGTGPYQVQKTTSLANPSWQNVGTPTTATSVAETVSGDAAFYRVVGQ